MQPPPQCNSKRNFISPKESSISIKHSHSILSFLQPLAITNLLLSIWIYLFWTFHINGITQYMTFHVCLISLSIMFSRFTCIVACMYQYVLLLWLTNIPLCAYTTFCLSIQWLIDIVSTFWLLWRVLLWTFVYKYWSICIQFCWKISGVESLW